MADHVLGFLAGGASKGIAITSELIGERKGKESAQARKETLNSQPNPENDDDDEDENLTEIDWMLDDAGLQQTQSNETDLPDYDASTLGQQIINYHENAIQVSTATD